MLTSIAVVVPPPFLSGSVRPMDPSTKSGAPSQGQRVRTCTSPTGWPATFTLSGKTGIAAGTTAASLTLTVAWGGQGKIWTRWDNWLPHKWLKKTKRHETKLFWKPSTNFRKSKFLRAIPTSNYGIPGTYRIPNARISQQVIYRPHYKKLKSSIAKF